MDRKSFEAIAGLQITGQAAVLSFTKEEKKISPFSWLKNTEENPVMQVFTLHLCQKTVWEWAL